MSAVLEPTADSAQIKYAKHDRLRNEAAAAKQTEAGVYYMIQEQHSIGSGQWLDGRRFDTEEEMRAALKALRTNRPLVRYRPVKVTEEVLS